LAAYAYELIGAAAASLFNMLIVSAIKEIWKMIKMNPNSNFLVAGITKYSRK
jgi:hypothetical protein